LLYPDRSPCAQRAAPCCLSSWSDGSRFRIEKGGDVFALAHSTIRREGVRHPSGDDADGRALRSSCQRKPGARSTAGFAQTKGPRMARVSSVLREYRDMNLAVAIDPAAEHAFGVERRRDVAVVVERDHAAIAAEFRDQAQHDVVGGLRELVALVFDARADVACGRRADVELAPACR